MSTSICIPISRIFSDNYRTRSHISDEGIAELAESIRRFGILSPLLVRRRDSSSYELIAGERRLLALRLLGCAEAQAIVLRAYDRDCALISLIENLQREELHFLDEAAACRRILDEHGLSQEELAANLSRSPSALANRLRLLKLDESVISFVRERGLSERHARSLLRLPDAGQQLRLATLAAEHSWSVRRLEGQIEALLHPSPPLPNSPRIRDKRLVLNAFRNTLQKLSSAGVQASSRVEEREDCYDVIITIRKNPG